MSNKKLIYGFHAVNARLFQNPKSLLELYIATGRQDARMRDAILKAESEGIRILSVDSARLDGMSVGESKQVSVAASEAYGEVDDEAIIEVNRADFPADPARRCMISLSFMFRSKPMASFLSFTRP